MYWSSAQPDRYRILSRHLLPRLVLKLMEVRVSAKSLTGASAADSPHKAPIKKTFLMAVTLTNIRGFRCCSFAIL
jgi:hypothetical protein